MTILGVMRIPRRLRIIKRQQGSAWGSCWPREGAASMQYVSLYFKTHRQYYYELLDAVRVTGDWEAWLDLFAEAVIVTELTAQKRNRLFSYTGYIEIMSRGTELPDRKDRVDHEY